MAASNIHLFRQLMRISGGLWIIDLHFCRHWESCDCSYIVRGEYRKIGTSSNTMEMWYQVHKRDSIIYFLLWILLTPSPRYLTRSENSEFSCPKSSNAMQKKSSVDIMGAFHKLHACTIAISYGWLECWLQKRHFWLPWTLVQIRYLMKTHETRVTSRRTLQQKK